MGQVDQRGISLNCSGESQLQLRVISAWLQHYRATLLQPSLQPWSFVLTYCTVTAW